MNSVKTAERIKAAGRSRTGYFVQRRVFCDGKWRQRNRLYAVICGNRALKMTNWKTQKPINEISFMKLVHRPDDVKRYSPLMAISVLSGDLAVPIYVIF